VRAVDVFHQKDGDVTKAFYAELATWGLRGELAVALFRAQKRSTAAKAYRRGRYRRAAYDVKNWSLSEICRLASRLGGVRWGWGRDESAPGFEWVLYLDLPQGQVSFHSATRLSGPDYPGKFDGQRGASEPRILMFCDAVLSGASEPPSAEEILGRAVAKEVELGLSRREQPLQTCVHGECVLYEVRAAGIRMLVCAECRDVLKRRLGRSLIEPKTQIIQGEPA